jgi:hypothetical protein
VAFEAAKVFLPLYFLGTRPMVLWRSSREYRSSFTLDQISLFYAPRISILILLCLYIRNGWAIMTITIFQLSSNFFEIIGSVFSIIWFLLLWYHKISNSLTANFLCLQIKCILVRSKITWKLIIYNVINWIFCDLCWILQWFIYIGPHVFSMIFPFFCLLFMIFGP